MSKGLVYILTNPCLDGWVKIGMTERNDIEQRLRELNTPTNIPLSFRCYACYKTDQPAKVEYHVHKLIDKIDSSLHAREILANGRIREREFFRISPETAYSILYSVADLLGNPEDLKPYRPTDTQAEEEAIANYGTRRGNNSFALLAIPVGEIIHFLYDNTITATVLDDRNKICFEGIPYTVSALANKLLIERCGWSETTRVNGWKYFVKDNMTLSDLRDCIERKEEED